VIGRQACAPVCGHLAEDFEIDIARKLDLLQREIPLQGLRHGRSAAALGAAASSAPAREKTRSRAQAVRAMFNPSTVRHSYPTGRKSAGRTFVSAAAAGRPNNRRNKLAGFTS